MTDFNWQTEEDRWDETPIAPEKTELTKRRWLPQALVALIILIAIGILLYHQVRRQLDAAVARTEDDVRRTHELVLQAADHSDRDLLNTMMSARDESWLYQQLDVAEQGLLYNPLPFGLVSQHDSPLHHEFELSADLNEAEVFTTRAFTVQSPTGISETILLKQYAIYRRAADRWLFAPPQDLDTFWGETQTEDGRYLTITYPNRDAEAAHTLFQYLDDKLAQMCTILPDFNCSNTRHIYLDLGTAPVSQAMLLDTDIMFQNTATLTLPTLTLIGTPVDEAAQDALYRGYATYVIRTAMINALEWECCQQGLFFRALLDYQLAQLGLSPYPLYPADYEGLFSRFRQINTFVDLWTTNRIELTDATDWQWVYALVQFGLTSPLANQSAAAAQQNLLDANSYLNWINDVLTDPVTDTAVQQAWLNFIYGRSLSGQVAEGEFVPQQDILMACTNGVSRTVLYRYNWSAGEWSLQDQFDDTTMFMASTPDDSAVIFQMQNLQTTSSESSIFFEASSAVVLWQDNQTTTLFSSPGGETSGYYFLGLISPDGRKLTMLRIRGDGFFLLDLDQCSDAGCQLNSIPGQPIWSPDSSQMIVELLQESFNALEITGLARVDKDGRIAKMWGRGFAMNPFWLGEEEYGYVQLGQEAGIYSALVVDDEPHLLLSEETLLQAFPEEERTTPFAIQRVVPNPANRNILAIITNQSRPNNSSISHLFLWNRATNELTLVDSQAQIVGGSWLLGGEWLVAPVFHNQPPGANQPPPSSYYLYNVSGRDRPLLLSHDQNLPFPRFDESVNGDWIVITKGDYLELIGLKHTLVGGLPYRRLLTHNFNNCANAVFIS